MARTVARYDEGYLAGMKNTISSENRFNRYFVLLASGELDSSDLYRNRLRSETE